MGGEAVPLSVVPAALHGASAVISGQAAPLASPTPAAPSSMESAALAGAALDAALDGYCATFAGRMATVAARLTGAAGAYTANEAVSSQTVAAITGIEQV